MKKLTLKQQEQRNKIKTILKWVFVGLGWSLLAFGFISLLVIGVRGCSNKKQVKANVITTPVLVNRNNDVPNNVIMNYDQAIGTYVDVNYNNSLYERVNAMCGYRTQDQVYIGYKSYASYYYNYFLNDAISFPYVNNLTSQYIGFTCREFDYDTQYNGQNTPLKKIMTIQFVFSTLDSQGQVLNNATYLHDNVYGFNIRSTDIEIMDKDDGTIRYSQNLLNGIGVPNGNNEILAITQWRMWFVPGFYDTFKPMLNGGPLGWFENEADYSNLNWVEGSAGLSLDNWVNQSGFERSTYSYRFSGDENPLTNGGTNNEGGNPGENNGVGGNTNDGLNGALDLISRAFGAMYNFFAIPVLPGITMGTFIALPMIALFIFFLVKLFKR